MNERDFQRSISRAYSVADELKISQSFSVPCSLGVNEEFRDTILDSKSTYLDVYYKAIQLGHYNFILQDFSFFQFSRNSDKDFRYAYYPNPHVDSDFSKIRELYDWVKEEVLDEEEFMAILDSAKLKFSIPPIRYEYAEDQYKELKHPCSHFHIGFHSENRWPLSKLLTPYAFTLLILNQYYSEHWKAGDAEEHEFKNLYSGYLVAERQECRRVAIEFFSEKDKRIFFTE